MGKWKAVRVRQELVDEVIKQVERSEYKGLSEFVSEAIRDRLQELAKQRVAQYLQRDRAARVTHPQLLYSPRHTWTQMTSDGYVEIGVTERFQKLLKEIVNIRIDTVGAEVSRNKPFGVAESWWFTHDLYSPLDGKIVAVNEKIAEDPLLLNADPSVWIVRVQPEGANTWADGLLSQQEYSDLTEDSQ
jgi:glycine cleavage system H protein